MTRSKGRYLTLAVALAALFVGCLTCRTDEPHRGQQMPSHVGANAPDPVARERRSWAGELAVVEPVVGPGESAEPVDDSWETVHGIVLARNGDRVTSAVRVDVRVTSTDETIRATATDGAGSWSMRVDDIAHLGALEFGAVDPASHDESARQRFTVSERSPVRLVVLRLRGTVLVVGDVVDSSGIAVTGAEVRLFMDHEPIRQPWLTGEGNDHTYVTTSDESGGFSFRVRRAPQGYVGARARDGPFGDRTSITVGDEAVVHAGSIVIPGRATSRWHLRFVSDDGSALRGVSVRLPRDELWTMASHPDYDDDRHLIVTNEISGIDLEFGCRDDRIVIGVGTPRHTVRGLALDLSVPRSESVTVRLRARPHGLLRVAGSAAQELLDAGARLRVRRRHPDAGGDGSPTVADIVTGAAVTQIGRDRRRLPHLGLSELLRSQGVVQIDSAVFEVRGDSEGAHDVSVQLGGTDVVSTAVDLRRQPTATVATMNVVGGRVVRIDWDALHRWRAQSGGGQTLASYGAWPTTAVTHDEESGARIVASYTLAPRGGDAGGEGGKLCEHLWLPTGADYVSFGFIERSFQGPRVVVGGSRDVHARAAALGTRGVVSAVRPDSTEFCVVRLGLIADGQRVQLGRIPIIVQRAFGARGAERGAPTGSCTLLSGDDGTAEVLLLPGRYRVGLSGRVAARTSQSARFFDVSSTARRMDVDLAFEIPR